MRRRSDARAPRAPRRRTDDGGFTLIELLITLLILPIIMSAIAAGLIAVLSIQGSVANRLSDSGDAQVTSANFVQDVQSAEQITTDATATQCGSGTQLLGLQWMSGGATTVITYAEVASGSSWLLVRHECDSGFSATPSTSSTVSFDIAANLTPPTLEGQNQTLLNTNAQAGWIPIQPVTSVLFPVTEPLSGYTFSLTADPAASSPPSTAGSPIIAATDTSCGFAPTQGGTVDNGNYAQTLCFVDFSAYNTPANAAAAQAPGGCLEMVASVPGGDVLSFCMSVSGTKGSSGTGSSVQAAPLPTYPAAFLGNTLTVPGISGNQPFYTGLGCPDSTAPETSSGGPTPSCGDPAMYQQVEGSTNTIEFTDITVKTVTGAPATGWEFVSADAETTDSGESIVWDSNAVLEPLWNTPGVSEYGDTCDNLPNWNGPQGFGTTEVTCQSGGLETSQTKTGTPMVEAVTPTSMTITMVGTGLEGIAAGLLLS
jgi:prepilin-type N-terminal cleavage/methylation domain-containing protein